MIIKFNKSNNTDVLLYHGLIEKSKIESSQISFSSFDTTTHEITVYFTESEAVVIRKKSMALFIDLIKRRIRIVPKPIDSKLPYDPIEDVSDTISNVSHMMNDHADSSKIRYLLDAISNNRIDFIKIELSKGDCITYINDSMDDTKETLLTRAVRTNNIDIVKMLLSIPQIDVNPRNCASPLSIAAQNGLLDIMRILLDHNANVNGLSVRADSQADHPLAYAVACGHFEAVKILLEKGANTNVGIGCNQRMKACENIADNIATDVIHGIPIILAVMVNRIDIVNLLLDNKASMDDLIGIYKPMSQASIHGNLDMIKLLLSRGGHIEGLPYNEDIDKKIYKTISDVMNYIKGKTSRVNEKSSGSTHYDKNPMSLTRWFTIIRDNYDVINESPLVFAAENGHHDLVRYLVERGARINTLWFGARAILDSSDSSTMEHDGYVCVALLRALKKGHHEIVDYLIKQGANANFEIPIKKVFLYAEMYKCNTAIEMASFLLKEFTNKEWMKNKITSPFEAAVESGNIEMVRYIINHLHAIDARISPNANYLMIAIDNKYCDIVELLLEKKLANSNESLLGNNPLTPIAQATAVNQIKIIRLLIKYGADINEAKNQKNLPLSIAAQQGNIEIVQYLLDHNAHIDSKKTCTNPVDFKRSSPLCMASMGGFVDVVKLLLDKGADWYGGEHGEETPLGLAVLNKHTEVVELLLANCKPSDVDAGTALEIKKMKSPLAVAAEAGDLAMVKRLVEAGADPDVSLPSELSPLACAVKKSRFNVVLWLLNRGYNPNRGSMVDCENTPLMLATRTRDRRIVNLLLLYGASIQTEDKTVNPLTCGTMILAGDLQIIQDLYRNLDQSESKERTSNRDAILNAVFCSQNYEMLIDLIKNDSRFEKESFRKWVMESFKIDVANFAYSQPELCLKKMCTLKIINRIGVNKMIACHSKKINELLTTLLIPKHLYEYIDSVAKNLLD